MKTIKALLIIFFVYAITIQFYEESSRTSRVQYLDELQSNLFENEYDMLIVDSYYSIGILDYDMLKEKYDFSIHQYSIKSDYYEERIFFWDDDVYFENMFGAFKPCKVPFSNLDNDCGFIYSEDYVVFATDKMENFDIDDPTIQQILILVKKNQRVDFVNEIKSTYDIPEENIFAIEIDSEYGNDDVRTRIEIVNILALIAVATAIVVIVKTSSQLKNFRIQSINGSSIYKVYYDNIFKYNLNFVALLIICVLAAAIYIKTNYNMWFATHYIMENILIVSLFIALIFSTSFITFILCFVTSTYNILDESNIFKKIGLFTVLLTVLTLLVFTNVFPISSLRIEVQNYFEYTKVTKKLVDEYSESYTTRAKWSYNIKPDYSNEQIEEYKNLLRENEYIIDKGYGVEDKISLTYISKDIAKIKLEYDFQKNKNYFYGPKCSELSSLTDSYKISEHINRPIKPVAHLNEDICIVVVDDIEIMFDDYVPRLDETTIYGENIESEFFIRASNNKDVNPYLKLNTEYKLLEFTLWLITLLLSNTLIFITYIHCFKKYEYYRYINDRKYPLLFRYMGIKMLINIMLLSLFVVNESLLYMLPVIAVDLILYLGFRLYYRDRLNKLKGE